MNASCSETGHSLAVLKNVILHEWEVLVREFIASSYHEPSVILRNHVPEILNQLEAIMNNGKVDEAELGKRHGFYRSTMTNFSVGDLLTEFSLLREVLMTYLYPMGDIACAKLIHKFLDLLSKHSVVEFLNDRSRSEEIPQIKGNPILPVVSGGSGQLPHVR